MTLKSNSKQQRRKSVEVRTRTGKCVACGSTVRLHTHHADRDRHNDSDANLFCVCDKCHGTIHAAQAKYGRDYDKNQHTIDFGN